MGLTRRRREGYPLFAILAGGLILLGACGIIGTLAPQEPGGTLTHTQKGGNRLWDHGATGVRTGAGPPPSVPFFINETGLIASGPGPLNWSVSVNRQNLSSDGSTSIQLNLPESASNVVAAPYPGFVPAAYAWVVDPTGPNQNLTIPWHPFLLNVSFIETGLPQGTVWSVTFNGFLNHTGSAQLGFEAQNGTYSFSVSAPPGFRANLTAGSITLLDRSWVQWLAFSPILYTLTFGEEGLPTGSNWSVVAAGLNQTSDSSAIYFEVPNGTLSYNVLPIAGYHAQSYSGSLDITGAPVTVLVKWTREVYSLVFSESGLPAGATWSLTLSGGTNSTNQTTILKWLTNGTYSFLVGGPAGYHGTPSSGTIALSGQPRTLSIQFVKENYSLTISETGLAPGELWGVTVNGTTWLSRQSQVNLSLANGTWSWALQTVPGFQGQPSSGSVLLQGAPQTLEVTFHIVTYLVTIEERGLPSGISWGVFLAGTLYNSQGPTLSLGLPNGTYSLQVAPVAGYEGASLPAGSLNVTGSPSVVSVAYTQSNNPGGHADPGPSGTWQSLSLLFLLVILTLVLIAFLWRRRQSRRQ